jgi:hypothetical protein
MRKLKLFIILLSTSTLSLSAIAQSNPFQTAWDSAIQNGAAGGGYWRATTGNYSIYSYDALYNVATATNALGAGLIAGGDDLRTRGQSVWNDVKGGFTINYSFDALRSVGYTNVLELKVYGGTAVATPHGSGVGVGNISFIGVDGHWDVYKQIVVHISPAYQTRVGQGAYDRNYPGIQFFVSLGGGTGSLLSSSEPYQRLAMRNAGLGDY